MKKVKFLLLNLLTFLTLHVNVVSAFEYGEEINICETESLVIFQMAGYVIFGIKIIVPIIIIILAIIELAKVVLSGEDKDFKATLINSLKRISAGVIVFFIPTLVKFLISVVDNMDETNSSFTNCNSCLFDPTKTTCESAVSQYKKN